MSGGGHGELGEWVRFLRDIGVRELRVDRGSEARGAAVADGPSPSWPDGQAQATASASSPPPAPRPKTAELFTLDAADAGATDDPAHRLREIREELGECTRCRLHEGRTNLVFGVGDPRAKLMFIGEGPGADEDAQGEPFVGRAGQKLNEMIRAIGLEREEVYIANVVKCRPPENRAPLPDEVGTCSPFLYSQIEAIRPRVIVTLGAPAARTVLGTKIGITRLRGAWHTYMGIPVMPTFHPAYLLRAYTPENRRKVWEDLKAARARMDEEP